MEQEKAEEIICINVDHGEDSHTFNELLQDPNFDRFPKVSFYNLFYKLLLITNVM